VAGRGGGCGGGVEMQLDGSNATHLVHNKRSVSHRLWHAFGAEQPHKLGLSVGRDTGLVSNVKSSDLEIERKKTQTRVT
jgi:hypothetical protein